MIGRLSGTIIEKTPPHLLLDVNGVGYELQAPMTTFYSLPAVGEPVVLHTHFVVREDAQLLYAFSHTRDRLLFRTITKVSGVGPKIGLSILSSMSADDFVRCIHSEDATHLVRIPGVGKKMAERLIVELKGHLKDWVVVFEAQADQANNGSTVGAATQAPPIVTSLPQSSLVLQEAVSALVALGYKSHHAQRIVESVKGQAETTEELVMLALRHSV